MEKGWVYVHAIYFDANYMAAIESLTEYSCGFIVNSSQTVCET